MSILRIVATDEKQRKVLELAKKSFEQRHVGTTIEIEQLPREILKARMSHGEFPDLVEWEGSHVGSRLEAEQILDLTPFLQEGDLDLSDYFPSVIQAAIVDGRIGAIPVMAEAPGVFYNKALFDQANLTYPQANWTWDEFVKKARKLNIYDTDGEVIRYGAYLVPRTFPLEPLAWSAGGAFLSDDGTQATGYLDSPETVETVQRYMEMYHPLELTPYQDLGSETWISCFIHQRMAMYYDANWTIKPMRQEHREQYGVIMPPRMGETPYRNLVQVFGYSISSQCEDPALAWAFLLELVSPNTAAGLEWAKHNLVVSRTAASLSGQQGDPLYAPFLASLEEARLSAFDVSDMKLWDHWNGDILQDWIARGGRVNVEQRLRRIAFEYDESRVNP